MQSSLRSKRQDSINSEYFLMRCTVASKWTLCVEIGQKEPYLVSYRHQAYIYCLAYFVN